MPGLKSWQRCKHWQRHPAQRLSALRKAGGFFREPALRIFHPIGPDRGF